MATGARIVVMLFAAGNGRETFSNSFIMDSSDVSEIPEESKITIVDRSEIAGVM